MKWVVVFLGLIASCAVGFWARGRPTVLPKFAVAIGFMPFYLLHLNPIGDELYRGDTRGLEFTLLDFTVIAFWIALPDVPTRSHARLARIAYFLVAAASIFWAPMPMFAVFG